VPIREAQGWLETLKNAVKVKPRADPANVVAALERIELRAVVAGLSDADRVPFVLGTTDARVVEAVLGAPAAVNGLSEDVFAMVETTYQERAFGPQLTRRGLCVGSASTSKVGPKAERLLRRQRSLQAAVWSASSGRIQLVSPARSKSN
jgi:hypothetical protein